MPPPSSSSLDARVRDTFFSAPSQVSLHAERRTWAASASSSSSSSSSSRIYGTPPASASPPPLQPGPGQRKRAPTTRRTTNKRTREEQWNPTCLLSLASYIPHSSAALSGLVAMAARSSGISESERENLLGRLSSTDSNNSAFKKRKFEDDESRQEKEKDMDAALNLHPRRRGKYEERNPEKVSPKKDVTAKEKLEFIKDEEAIKRRKAREMDAVLGLVSASEGGYYKELPKSSVVEDVSEDKQPEEEENGAQDEAEGSDDYQDAKSNPTDAAGSVNAEETVEGDEPVGPAAPHGVDVPQNTNPEERAAGHEEEEKIPPEPSESPEEELVQNQSDRGYHLAAAVDEEDSDVQISSDSEDHLAAAVDDVKTSLPSVDLKIRDHLATAVDEDADVIIISDDDSSDDDGSKSLPTSPEILQSTPLGDETSSTETATSAFGAPINEATESTELPPTTTPFTVLVVNKPRGVGRPRKHVDRDDYTVTRPKRPVGRPKVPHVTNTATVTQDIVQREKRLAGRPKGAKNWVPTGYIGDKGLRTSRTRPDGYVVPREVKRTRTGGFATIEAGKGKRKGTKRPKTVQGSREKESTSGSGDDLGEDSEWNMAD